MWFLEPKVMWGGDKPLNTKLSTGVHQPKGVLKTQTLPPNCHSNKGNNEPLNFRVSHFQSNPFFGTSASINHQPKITQSNQETQRFRPLGFSATGFSATASFGAIWLSILLVKIWDEMWDEPPKDYWNTGGRNEENIRKPRLLEVPNRFGNPNRNFHKNEIIWCRLGAHVGPSWAMLGLSWAILGLILGHLGAMLGQGGTPPRFFCSIYVVFFEEQKTP